MKIIVTGGCGFLGSTIAQQLLAEGHEVTLVDLLPPGVKGLNVDTEYIQGDVRDGDFMERLFCGADEVYHMAGVLGTAELQASASLAVDTNIRGTVTVFEKAREAGVARVCYPGKPNIWLNTYTITKNATEQFARMFNEAPDRTRIISLRYFNAYGPGQSVHPIRKIVPTFAIRAMAGLPIEVWGDGEQTVDMIFSRDVAALTIDFTRRERTDIVPDCGSGTQLTVNDVALAVNEYLGNNAGIEHLPMRPGETPRSVVVANTSVLVGVLGELQLAPWESSLAETLDWYASIPKPVIEKAMAAYGWWTT